MANKRGWNRKKITMDLEGGQGNKIYLGYIFQKNNNDNEHIREWIKRTRNLMAQMCSIEEINYKNDF